MHYTPLLLPALWALTSAAPSNTFNIHVQNKCPFPKSFATYQITPSFSMLQKSSPVSIRPNTTHTFPVSFTSTGMRLSGHAEWPLASQWNPQALFEWGYAVVEGKRGTAYDLSVMEGSDKDIGIGVYPLGNRGCESKTCFPWDCPVSQGWTRPEQVEVGSPADTGCYGGKTDFRVVFCP